MNIGMLAMQKQFDVLENLFLIFKNKYENQNL